MRLRSFCAAVAAAVISSLVPATYGDALQIVPTTTPLLALKPESESRGGQFWFGVDYEGGPLTRCHTPSGCDVTQQAISALPSAYNPFKFSPAYLRINGQPVVMFFDPDRYGNLN